jgi:nitrite reductase (NO-forming)
MVQKLFAKSLIGNNNMKTSFLIFLVSSLLVSVIQASELPVEKGILTDAPMVPPVITRDHPAKVQVELEVIEKIGKLSDGVDYTFWTFGGSVPGKFIRVRQGDTVEFTLVNNEKNKLPHNIDLHAVNGPGGGASVTATAPGQKSKFTFKTLNPGLYVYHCATAPVGMHIANGMYGMIYVQPEVPLPKVDHEYYVFQSEFYTKGKNGDKGLQQFSQEKAVDEKPTYIVFNGAQGALVGDNALKAKVGETVRFFVGNGGPNLISSFHVIGEIFDKVYTEGGTKFQDNVQTTLIPSGGSTIVEFKLNTVGTYLLVDHSIFRTFHKGTLGMLKVEGEADTTVFKAEAKPAPEGEKKEATPDKKVEVIKSEAPKVTTGKELFTTNCSACHGDEGKGVEGAIPPLAKSDYLKKLSSKKDRSELISFPLLGKKGKIVVNNKEYDGEMPMFGEITDRELAEVFTYVSNSWGNKAKKFTEAEVRIARKLVASTHSK